MRLRGAPRGFIATSEGDRGDSVLGGAGEGALRDRDVRDGREHAGEDGDLLRTAEERRFRVSLFKEQRVHADVRQSGMLFLYRAGADWTRRAT